MGIALIHMPSERPVRLTGSSTVGNPAAAAAVRYSSTYVCCCSGGGTRTCSLASVRLYSSPALVELRPAAQSPLNGQRLARHPELHGLDGRRDPLRQLFGYSYKSVKGNVHSMEE